MCTGGGRGTMFNTLYVIEADAAERHWIAAALAGQAQRLVFLDGAVSLGPHLPSQDGDCLLCSAEPDAGAVLALVRGLRADGETLPVLMTGPHGAFRAAVDLARLQVTDFLERPFSAQRLRGALHRIAGHAVRPSPAPTRRSDERP